MTNQRKIHVVGSATGFASNWMQGSAVDTVDKADVVVFPGGADIEPSIYGDKTYPTTHFNKSLDAFELKHYHEAVEKKKMLVGICRGAQLLCAMAGGKLVQHQANIDTYHNVLTYDGQILNVNSEHHQAMYPWGLSQDKYAVLGWSFGQSPYHLGGNGEEMVIDKAPLSMEVEIAYFPGNRGLGIQFHPEWMWAGKDHNMSYKKTISYVQSLLNIFLSGHDFKESVNAYACPV